MNENISKDHYPWNLRIIVDCPLCDLKDKTLKDVRIHLLNSHSHEVVQRCFLCNAVLSSIDHSDEHLKVEHCEQRKKYRSPVYLCSDLTKCLENKMIKNAMRKRKICNRYVFWQMFFEIGDNGVQFAIVWSLGSPEVNFFESCQIAY